MSFEHSEQAGENKRMENVQLYSLGSVEVIMRYDSTEGVNFAQLTA
ncbi:hypothetical protein N9Y42_04040 [Mariniblastus sp.]|nr:hypothetical protein [Mariniblastus sp.]